MTDRDPIDDALDVAIERTRTAQDRVSREMAERDAPEPSTTEVLVERAHDLDDLAHDAATSDAPPDSESDRSTVDPPSGRV